MTTNRRGGLAPQRLTIRASEVSVDDAVWIERPSAADGQSGSFCATVGDVGTVDGLTTIRWSAEYGSVGQMLRGADEYLFVERRWDDEDLVVAITRAQRNGLHDHDGAADVRAVQEFVARLNERGYDVVRMPRDAS